MNSIPAHFLKKYANWDQMCSAHITFDIDFAPDYMISHTLNILEEYNAPATFFVTHRSPLLVKLNENDNYEFGAHPYIGPNTTQGNGLGDIIGKLMAIHPRAAGNRFHVLHYSYRDLAELGRLGFKYDVSTLRFNCPYLLPSFHKDLNMTLLTYFWEDGICENSRIPLNLKSINPTTPGIKIFNFHPMNIYINGRDSTARLKFMRENKDILNCPKSIADGYRQKGEGAESFLIELLEFLKGRNCRLEKLSSMVSAYTSVEKEIAEVK